MAKYGGGNNVIIKQNLTVLAVFGRGIVVGRLAHREVVSSYSLTARLPGEVAHDANNSREGGDRDRDRRRETAQMRETAEKERE